MSIEEKDRKKKGSELKEVKIQIRIDPRLKKKFRLRLLNEGLSEQEFLLGKIKDFIEERTE